MGPSPRLQHSPAHFPAASRMEPPLRDSCTVAGGIAQLQKPCACHCSANSSIRQRENDPVTERLGHKLSFRVPSADVADVAAATACEFAACIRRARWAHRGIQAEGLDRR